MANYITTDTELTSIADAIRTKGSTSSQLAYPADFISAISNLPTGGGPISITRLAVLENNSESTSLTNNIFSDHEYILGIFTDSYLLPSVDTKKMVIIFFCNNDNTSKYGVAYTVDDNSLDSNITITKAGTTISVTDNNTYFPEGDISIFGIDTIV